MKILTLVLSVLILLCTSALAQADRHSIFTTDAPKPIGPYSQAVQAGNMLFCSGQIALDSSGKLISVDIKQESKQVLNNLRAVLKAAGLDMKSIVKTTIYLTDLNDFKSVNEVYASFFTSDFPARETVQVAALPKGAHVEISVIAMK
ncbi:MAG: RidA family protein [Candidatus Kapabacteria bacterium]|nr:RidA family protein [Candidatus Kapabacteria bacterium]